VASVEGQQAFNTRKGSIPARSDADPADYPAYQRAAIADLQAAIAAGVAAYRAGAVTR
jgi:glucose/mannose transport system substrate-binding protein